MEHSTLYQVPRGKAFIVECDEGSLIARHAPALVFGATHNPLQRRLRGLALGYHSKPGHDKHDVARVWNHEATEHLVRAGPVDAWQRRSAPAPPSHRLYARCFFLVKSDNLFYVYTTPIANPDTHGTAGLRGRLQRCTRRDARTMLTCSFLLCAYVSSRQGGDGEQRRQVSGSLGRFFSVSCP
jgi:hypothetical protein